MRGLFAAVVIGAVALAAGPGSAQSLGELAAKEREKRNKTRAAGKVYSDEDLRKQGATADAAVAAVPAEGTAGGSEAAASRPAGESGVAASETSTTSGDGAGQEPDPAEQARADREKNWRDRYNKANDELTRAQTELQKVQIDYDNAPEGARLQYFQAPLDAAKRKVEAARQAVDTLEDERRWNGYRN